MRIFTAIFIVFILFIFLNLLTGYMNSRVLMKKKRDKKLKDFEKEGYKVSKRWDCNVMTIVIDEEKKVIGCVVLGLTSKLYIIDIKDITSQPEVKTSGVLPKFTTNVCVVFKCKDNNFYFLRTLTIKKGFGVFEKSNTVKKAIQNAEEILRVLKDYK